MQPESKFNKESLQIIEFLKFIGLEVVEKNISQDTFLPGIAAENGTLIVDPEKLKYPGDLLHEAGHLAVLSGEERKLSMGDFPNDGGEEMGAIAWSYAACVYLKLPAEVVFHKAGYKGEAKWLIDLFTNGTGLGVPVLEWKNMTNSEGENAYPAMKNWLCP